MQKNKFIHPDIKAVCNCATKKLVAMGLVVAAMGSAVIPNIAQAQFDPNAGFYNTGEEKKETPEGDKNQNDRSKPINSENMSLQICETKDGCKYVVIPSGVTAVVNQEGASAHISDNGSGIVCNDGHVEAGYEANVVAQGGSYVVLERLTHIILSDGRTFVYRGPNEFLEVTSSDISTLRNQEPFSLTRPLPVSPCPAPPHPDLDQNGSVSEQSFVKFLLALPNWIEEIANTFKLDPNQARVNSAKVFFQAMQKGKK